MKKIEREWLFDPSSTGIQDAKYVKVLASDLTAQEAYIEQLEEYREELIQMFKNLIKEKKYTTYCAYADNGWSHEESMRKAQNDIKKELEFLHETRR